MKHVKIVILGGGLGASAFTIALKNLDVELTTIVSAFDNGGSTGSIRRDYGGFGVGDFRNCLLAASNLSDELKQALNFRFSPGHLHGAQVGNVLVKAILDTSKNFTEANKNFKQLFGISQTVLPVSLDESLLVAELSNGNKFAGQNEIANYLSFLKAPIRSMKLTPKAYMLPAAKKAVEEADVLLFAPGHFFTSLLPNAYVQDFKKSWKKSKAKKFWFVNLLAHKGQDSFYTLKDYVAWFELLLGEKPFDVLVANQRIPKSALRQVADRFALLQVTENDERVLQKKGMKVVYADLVSPKLRVQKKNDPIARAPLVHDPVKIRKYFLKHVL